MISMQTSGMASDVFDNFEDLLDTIRLGSKFKELVKITNEVQLLHRLICLANVPYIVGRHMHRTLTEDALAIIVYSSRYLARIILGISERFADAQVVHMLSTRLLIVRLTLLKNLR